MSSQHKLYDYQVTPPAGAWNNIADELEALQQFKTVAQKMQDLEVVPPALSWSKIQETIEDEKSFSNLKEKFANFEVAPPVAAWTQIAGELNIDKPAAKPAPAKSGSFKWIKYAVAACVVGLLGFGAFYLIEKSNKDSQLILSGIDQKNNKGLKNLASIDLKDKPVVKQTVPTVENPVLTNAHTASTQIKTASGNTYNTTVEKNKALQGRYIMLMTEDGDVVRMSKKLGNMADCVAGESANNDCDDQIEQWQREIAKAPVSATPDNFLDLLELADNETAGM